MPYEPQVNRTYSELAAHYSTSVLAARPYRPRDKAKVENCVGTVERWLFGRLRNRTWYSMDELRAAVAGMMATLNDKIMRRVGRLVNQIAWVANMPETLPHMRRSPDSRDDFLLGLCQAGSADWLVTGDKDDLLALKSHGNTRIVAAMMLAEQLGMKRMAS